MRAVIRPFLAFCLVMLLALTSQSMALARVAPDPSGQMVLCTGTGPIMVYTDDAGQPVGPPHFCPECALGLILAVAPPDVAVARVESEGRLSVAFVAVVSSFRTLSAHRARAPPFSV